VIFGRVHLANRFQAFQPGKIETVLRLAQLLKMSGIDAGLPRRQLEVLGQASSSQSGTAFRALCRMACVNS